MEPLRVGVVGVGSLGQHHARVYRELSCTELVGVVDADEAAAKRVGKKNRTEWSADLDLLLDKAQAVSVAVPTIYHHDVAMKFLERGISVLVEKPMTFSVEEAEALVRVAAENNAKLQVGHIERFNPGFKAIADHDLHPVFIECDRLSPFRFRSTDVSVVFDLMIHDLDIVQHLVGSEIVRIDAVGVPVISKYEDIANARIVFKSGCVANLTSSRVSMKSLRKIRVFSPNCYVAIDTQEKEAHIYRKGEGFDQVAEKLKDAGNLAMLNEMRKMVFGDLVHSEKIKLDDVEPLKAELESFATAVIEDREPEVTGEDGVKAVRVAADVVAALRTHMETTGLDRYVHMPVG
jgi:predicted dehydrogenase